MPITHCIDNEDVTVGSRLEDNGAIRVWFVGGSNEANRDAAKLGLAFAVANGLTHGGYVRFGRNKKTVRWLVNEWNCARLHREVLLFPGPVPT